MKYVLRDPENKKFFCDPHGDDSSQWNPDPEYAHPFFNLEQAVGALKVYLQIHNQSLQVIVREDALRKFAASKTNDV